MNRHLAELDLHGLTREKAIRAVTDFMEDNKRKHVRIITGTGSHSTHGPVLRTAVESLLTRRKMQFQKDSAGSFLVNCASGDTFYPPESPQDTKLLVVASAVPPPPPIQRAVSIPQSSYSIPPTRTRRVVSTTRIRNADGSMEETTSMEELITNQNEEEQVYAECTYADEAYSAPWLTAAKQTGESDYYKALEGSLEDYRLQTKTSEQDSDELDKVLQLSLKAHEEQEMRRKEQERAELEKAIQLSEKIAAEQRQRNVMETDEDKLFLMALERSKSDTQYKSVAAAEEEDEELKRILELSKQEAQMLPLEQDDEEELLRKILEESKALSRSETLPDRELEDAIRRAMEQSLEEERKQREEEELLQQVLRMSMR
ncbi:hypothetical protein FisN_8Hh182 [Fistulifera solaris]|jgi:hypothetical protein|uniref:Smr domain-containing protein n=1 Tax=Fistulifera solaris TaxID=1519565 RepID=A0A1Z5JYM3_FISSO|nr:hypothetical protein FisN_8Hh182 [Fistulifera solaris]|eukprot:GAX18962.1 hypothetical protein FisN_8Hh182 [Fistulifera solaris]